MEVQDAIDSAREALWVTFQIGGPILLVILAVSLLVGFLQGLTQLHDSAIASIPRIAIVLLTLCLCLPWLADRLMDYTAEQLSRPPALQVSTPETSN